MIKGVINRILHLLARSLPGRTSIRPFLHRLRGVSVGQGVAIGDDVYLENEHPSSIEIQDGVHIAMRCTIVAHTRGKGRIILEKDSFVGACTLIVCPAGQTLTIGAGAVVAAGSVVVQSIDAALFCGPPKINIIGRATIPFTTASYPQFIRGLRPLRKVPAASTITKSHNQQ
jgi:carbonic anhydrase/acetyltransferase-like protein (isoleucine patch superfamily)